MDTQDPVAITTGISPDKYDLYLEADSLIAARLGISPGADLLMTTILENEEDPLVLAELYCVRQLNQPQ
jgi:hypothetical protein